MKNVIAFLLIFVLAATAFGQDDVYQKIPLIGSEAPSFQAKSTQGNINFPADFGDNWKILFAHPKDYTPVCSSELLELAYNQNNFEKLGAKFVVVSSDILDSHHDWIKALEEVEYKKREKVSIEFPLVEDASMRIVNSYGMVDQQASAGQSIRGVFFIDPEDKIRAFYFYPNEVGRSIEEIKRTLVALQTVSKDPRYAVPANWNKGDDIMLTYLNEADKNELTKDGSMIYELTWFMTYKKLR